MQGKGTLYLLPMILSEGRFEVIPPVTADLVGKLDYFLVENIRTSRRYISGMNLGLDISALRFEVVDKNTSHETIDRLLKPLQEGVSAGVLSESGSPGVADPGAKLVSRAHSLGIRVVPIPGPSSILLSLMASGFNGQKFAFHGYLPIQKQERARALKSLELESRKNDQTQIFIETPYRNMQMLEAILENCAGNTRVCVARDVTGEQELVKSAPVSEWKKSEISLHKIPAVFLLYAGSGN